MEKICIVSLRRNMVHPGDVKRDGTRRDAVNGDQRLGGLPSARTDHPGIREIDDRLVHSHHGKDEADGTVSLMLTQDQTKTLRSNPDIESFLSATHAGGAEATRDRNGTVVVKFEFASMPRLRLLKAEEVVQMLRISRSYLNRLVGQGVLKSYKLGRLRRFVLDDVLSFLEESRELIEIRRQDSKSKKILKGITNVM